MDATDILTSGDIARRLNRRAAQVRNVLRTRNELQPCGKAGIVNLYRPSVLPIVEAECAALDKPGRRRARRVAIA